MSASTAQSGSKGSSVITPVSKGPIPKSTSATTSGDKSPTPAYTYKICDRDKNGCRVAVYDFMGRECKSIAVLLRGKKGDPTIYFATKDIRRPELRDGVLDYVVRCLKEDGTKFLMVQIYYKKELDTVYRPYGFVRIPTEDLVYTITPDPEPLPVTVKKQVLNFYQSIVTNIRIVSRLLSRSPRRR